MEAPHFLFPVRMGNQVLSVYVPGGYSQFDYFPGMVLMCFRHNGELVWKLNLSEIEIDTYPVFFPFEDQVFVCGRTLSPEGSLEKVEVDTWQIDAHNGKAIRKFTIETSGKSLGYWQVKNAYRMPGGLLGLDLTTSDIYDFPFMTKYFVELDSNYKVITYENADNYSIIQSEDNVATFRIDNFNRHKTKQHYSMLMTQLGGKGKTINYVTEPIVEDQIRFYVAETHHKLIPELKNIPLLQFGSGNIVTSSDPFKAQKGSGIIFNYPNAMFADVERKPTQSQLEWTFPFYKMLSENELIFTLVGSTPYNEIIAPFSVISITKWKDGLVCWRTLMYLPFAHSSTNYFISDRETGNLCFSFNADICQPKSNSKKFAVGQFALNQEGELAKPVRWMNGKAYCHILGLPGGESCLNDSTGLLFHDSEGHLVQHVGFEV